MSGHWKLGFRNLLRNRRRTLVTGLSVMLGVAGIVFTYGYLNRVQEYMRVTYVYLLQMGHLSIRKQDGLVKYRSDPETYSLTAEEQAKIAEVLRQDPSVERFSGQLLGIGLASNSCKTVPVRTLGIDPGHAQWVVDQPDVIRITPEMRTFMRGQGLWQYPSVAGGIGLSRGLADLLGKPKVHDDLQAGAGLDPRVIDCAAPDVRQQIALDANVQLVGSSFDGSFAVLDGEVVNIFPGWLREFEDSTVVMPLQILQQFYGTDAVTAMGVYLKDPRQVVRVATDLEARLRAAGLQVTVYPWSHPDISPVYQTSVQMLRVLSAGVLLILSVVVMLSILNAMTMAVLERGREFGTLRAIGYTPRGILRLLAWEAAILAGVGAVGGVGLAFVLAGVVNASNVRMKGPNVPGTIQFMVHPTPAIGAVVGSIVFCLAIGTTLWVARKRLRERIVGLLYAA